MIKTKSAQDDEARMFAKFKEMLDTLQVSISFHEIFELMPKFTKFIKALLKRTKEKMVKKHVSMTEKDDVVITQSLPPKLKDPGKFTISYNISGVNILHALCDLVSSINVMPLKMVKELKVGETTPSTMTLTLTDSFFTQPIYMLCDMLQHVDELVFHTDFVVLDTKRDSGRSVILRRPFLATGNAKIDIKMGELILKFNKEKVVFKVYDWTPYMENLDTFYHLEEKGRKLNKGIRRSEVTGVRVSLAPDVP
ncbi:uncharacterized protein LOC127123850 [Lathyrus oleraceus]|uniref:uncharacterized protein LOC127123850 n=1 Tax=Pisum sativum TaxID=3888 RepID=UPI0021CF1A67|nr:uncharacterized protein LOC127123850 [Pisum sativum]